MVFGYIKNPSRGILNIFFLKFWPEAGAWLSNCLKFKLSQLVYNWLCMLWFCFHTPNVANILLQLLFRGWKACYALVSLGLLEKKGEEGQKVKPEIVKQNYLASHINRTERSFQAIANQ